MPEKMQARPPCEKDRQTSETNGEKNPTNRRKGFLDRFSLQCMAVWDTDLFLVFQPGNGSYLFYIGKGTLGTASVFAFPSSPGDILSHGLVRSFQMVF